ncbi:MAG TPA: hypothetical protein VFZ66_29820 [Herpetosiphonaceae bacterium]
MISVLTNNTIIIRRKDLTNDLVQQFQAKHGSGSDHVWRELPAGFQSGLDDSPGSYDDAVELDGDPNMPRGTTYRGVIYETTNADMQRDAELISAYLGQRDHMGSEQWHTMMRQKLQERGYRTNDH